VVSTLIKTGVVAMVIAALPDIKRYVKMSTM
jgi:hypothetical protein